MKRTIAGLLVAGLFLAACEKSYKTYPSTVSGPGSDYTTFATKPCGTVLTGTLAGITLAPGVYCFDAAATLTGLLTLDGTSNPSGTWLFRVGTTGVGALTGTTFNMVMAGGGNPCNVNWRVTDAITFTDSNIIGSFLAGKAITLTGGTLQGQVWSQINAITVTGTTAISCAPQLSPLNR
jgi:hypothetical protein